MINDGGLIRRIGVVPIRPFTFRATDVMVRGVNRDGVKIGWLGDDFLRLFGDAEEQIGEAGLVVRRLQRRALDVDLLAAMPDGFRTARVGQLYRAVQQQPRGESGRISSCFPNVTFKYVGGVPWSVVVEWRREGWLFAAYRAASGNPFERPRGTQLLTSR